MNKKQRELADSWQKIVDSHKPTNFARKKFYKPESQTLSLKSFGNYRGAEQLAQLKSLVTPGGSTAVTSKTDLFNLRNESKEVVEEILYKASCTAPIHKSSYIYVTEGMDPASLGRKNEVL